MANGTRPFPLLIVLVIGAAVGWFIGHSKPEPEPYSAAPGNHLMKVGPAAKDVGSSMKKVHKIAWKARDAKMSLEIRFRAVDFPPGANHQPPFKKDAQENQDQVFKCGPGEACNPGDVNDVLNVPADGLYYKYWQTLIDQNGKRDEADAGIIIER